jgi:hypothetical protein
MAAPRVSLFLELCAQAGAAFDASRVRGRLRAPGMRRRLVSTPRPGRGRRTAGVAEIGDPDIEECTGR